MARTFLGDPLRPPAPSQLDTLRGDGVAQNASRIESWCQLLVQDFDTQLGDGIARSSWRDTLAPDRDIMEGNTHTTEPGGAASDAN